MGELTEEKDFQQNGQNQNELKVTIVTALESLQPYQRMLSPLFYFMKAPIAARPVILYTLCSTHVILPSHRIFK